MAQAETIKVACIGAGYVGGSTMAMMAWKCPNIIVTCLDLNEVPPSNCPRPTLSAALSLQPSAQQHTLNQLPSNRARHPRTHFNHIVSLHERERPVAARHVIHSTNCSRYRTSILERDELGMVPCGRQRADAEGSL